jgi:hypothetical protein
MQPVPITTDVVMVSSNLDQGELGVQSLSVTCDRSVVFSGSSTNKTNCHAITERVLKVALITKCKLNSCTFRVNIIVSKEFIIQLNYDKPL